MTAVDQQILATFIRWWNTFSILIFLSSEISDHWKGQFEFSQWKTHRTFLTSQIWYLDDRYEWKRCTSTEDSPSFSPDAQRSWLRRWPSIDQMRGNETTSYSFLSPSFTSDVSAFSQKSLSAKNATYTPWSQGELHFKCPNTFQGHCMDIWSVENTGTVLLLRKSLHW